MRSTPSGVPRGSLIDIQLPARALSLQRARVCLPAAIPPMAAGGRVIELERGAA